MSKTKTIEIYHFQTFGDTNSFVKMVFVKIIKYVDIDDVYFLRLSSV